MKAIKNEEEMRGSFFLAKATQISLKHTWSLGRRGPRLVLASFRPFTRSQHRFFRSQRFLFFLCEFFSINLSKFSIYTTPGCIGIGDQWPFTVWPRSAIHQAAPLPISLVSRVGHPAVSHIATTISFDSVH
jgi:hypothetical protein